MQLTESHKVYKIVASCPGRNRLIIASYTAANLYMMTYEDNEYNRYISDGFWIKETGILELDDYEGAIWGVTDVANHDVRVIQTTHNISGRCVR